MSQLIL
jgi:hypothetical protein